MLNNVIIIIEKKKIYYKATNKYIIVHYLQRQRQRHRKEQYNKEKKEKEREWQPLLNSKFSPYHPRSSSSTYICA